MKKILWLLAIFILGCKDSNKSPDISRESTINAGWLVGTWERINEKEGIQTYEKWELTPEKTYEGIGWTMRENDTIFKEVLRIVEIDDQWNLEISGVNESPTLFEITSQTSRSFVSENKENEFPKKIQYQMQGEQLHAIISNPGREIKYIFEKTN
ncbi:hypothetical protein FK178_07645 [Antarcticibacterium arcticum]|uniref:DUF6265 domain-containing protein n=1 Tax=Antarcticibacterium arcticum TaxID=2585771 RepID=A0A5B8YMX7_9FLAO|nr:DUF6265 family protein [Antarcticibacterium arcticum]QED37606.1 hypothetical protein FK178_07645 [Antarcticibacterium arcticum]